MKNVNSTVDIHVRLLAIIGVDIKWEREHRIRALEVNGKSRALKDISDLQEQHPKDYRQMMDTLRMAAEQRRVLNTSRVRRGRGKVCRDVYAMKGGQARMFFFYTPDEEEIVVCTHTYWKAKPSTKEQNEAFGVAAKMRQLYLNGVRQHTE